ncbi:ACL011Cp [Eremothecium gossypii ATCC 10895]|uniref:Altered inheritance of mitochondria protein 34, mitochondrial n=1 Tax=Eremothecium gossypii (strain ATCC 10895 / CBS 109.51 / FGSC 9923 / NRRL Y-1056) TaxID=284811 RepID=AIM34_EREGS|nr:ACL011Cp [Eremothecium gossypii ATCC 10895]Q75CC0.1 RecName: Full=Altered inheritance of mitochondria protein 34, mitochondrial; Flags: Precursor [Eremothecium gossypii ATCC 10895]AAS51217.1 ACL011Cp [Eremothecium gossypii ATCC 10895]AEY95508.1 FACL011Cp [Eremothecium gossypii FDAG1]
MSLRRAKSLPSLKNIAEVAKPITKAPPLPLLAFEGPGLSTCRWYPTTVRTVHNTPSKAQTTLLSTAKKESAFSAMNLKALRNECRSRGLQVSGRKSDLIERIVDFELKGPLGRRGTRRAFHSPGTSSASVCRPVDKVTMPDIALTERAVQQPEKNYILRIPSLSREAASHPVTKSEKDLAQGADEDADPTSEEGRVLTPDSDLHIESPVVINKIEIINEDDYLQDDSRQSSDSQGGSQQDSDGTGQQNFSPRDRRFFAGLTAAVGLWWYFGNKSAKRRMRK